MCPAADDRAPAHGRGRHGCLLLRPSERAAGARHLARGHPQDPARGDRDAGEPLLRLLLRNLPGGGRDAPAPGQFTVCSPDPRSGLLPLPYHDHSQPQHRRAARAPRRGPGRQRRQDGRLRPRGQARPDARLPASARTLPLCSLGARASGRHGLPRPARDPELLGLRAPLRPAGPHVPAGHLLEPAGPPVHGLRVVGALLYGAPTRRAASTRSRTRSRRRTRRRTRPASGRTTRGPTSRTCCTGITSPGATTSSPGTSRTARRRRWSAPRSSSVRRRRGSGTRCPWFDTVKARPPAPRRVPISHFFRAARRGRLPAVSWVTPNNHVSEHPPSLVTAGQAYVTSVINAVMRSPDWRSTAIFLAWDDWGGFYDHVAPPQRRRERLRPARAGARDLAVRAPRAVDHQMAELRRLREVHRGRLPGRRRGSTRRPTAGPIRGRRARGAAAARRPGARLRLPPEAAPASDPAAAPARSRSLGGDGRTRLEGPGAGALDRLARLRRERRRAAERVRRLRPARAAGRPRARARDEGEAQPRRGARGRGARARPAAGRGAVRSTTPPAAAAASRISPTTRRSRPRRSRSPTRCAGSAGSRSRPSSRSSRPRRSSTTATSSSTRSRRRRRAGARLPPGRPLGRGARHPTAAG